MPWHLADPRYESARRRARRLCPTVGLALATAFLLGGCARDYALFEGFNPKIKFSRTQTIMEGAKFCDFRFEVEK